MSDAAELRRAGRRARRALTDAERAEFSQRITAHLLDWPAFQAANTVMAYASMPDEVDTWPLLSAILSQGKVLLLPRCTEDRRMEAVRVDALNALQPKTLGIPEPAYGETVPARDIPLILTPGVAFDSQGHRIGQGGGYYDRFLAECAGIACGIAFSAQLVDEITPMPWDRPMHALATETGIIQFQ